jgi:hypothetical protein
LSRRRSAGSPITSAASARASILSGSGGMSMNSGSIFQWRRLRIRARPTELREFVSSAKLSAISIGTFDTTKRLRTSCLDAIAIPGNATTSSMRWYSMDGMMPTSARPARKSSAHCEGTANDRSYLPASGPSVKPQTSGAVFRNSTMEMRSLPIIVEARGRFNIAQPGWRPGTFEHAKMIGLDRPGSESFPDETSHPAPLDESLQRSLTGGRISNRL